MFPTETLDVLENLKLTSGKWCRGRCALGLLERLGLGRRVVRTSFQASRSHQTSVGILIVQEVTANVNVAWYNTW